MPNAADNHSYLISKKAYEIAYALFRVAAVVKKQSFAEHLESRGLSLLVSSASEDYSNAKTIAAGLDYLLKFGADIGAISQANSQSITDELAILNSAIAELKKSANDFSAVGAETADLGGIFSKMPAPKIVYAAANFINENKPEDPAIAREGVVVHNGQNNGTGVGMNGNGIVKSAMRQSAIMERIRQNGNCRLKEIQELLPETSERTLRYDVAGLLEKGLIERVGNGGPATYYKAKNTAF